MIVIVASARDLRARAIVAHWGPQCATMLTAEDLCSPGWRLSLPLASPSIAVAGGRPVPSDQISGILTLRPCVFPEELNCIQSPHRKYVAAELNSFLLAWLAAQSCPVLNSPTASCLAGPNWRPEQWTQAAAKLQIPAEPRRYSSLGTAVPVPSEIQEVITIGDTCFGCEDQTLRDRTLLLARAAGVDLLSARFSAESNRFISASAWPQLTSPAVLEALRNKLEPPA